jgi:putative oxidoreductase
MQKTITGGHAATTALAPQRAAYWLPILAAAGLGLLMLVFGLNKFLQFIPVAPPTDATAQQFLGAMFSTYLGPVTGIVEIVAGTLLLSRRTAFGGSLLLLPVTFNIVAFHLAHDMPGNGLWLGTSLLHVAVVYTQRQQWAQLLSISFNHPKN